MFKKSNANSDVKKSQQKCTDIKRDTPTRLKHLKTILDGSDVVEIKNFLEANFSVVFHLFYDSFITAECNLKQKGAFAVQRSYREDFEHCLFFLDRILCFLPELIKQRWQCNAFTHIFKKLLHMNNTIRLKREAMRLFLLWYMIVGENKTDEMDCMFASLIDGFPAPPLSVHQIDLRGSKVSWVEPSPILTSSNTEKSPDDLTAYMLRYFLEFMVSQVRRVEWKDKLNQHPVAFSYILQRFRSVYLPYIFPNFNPKNSIYKPNLELPELRTSPDVSQFGSCPAVLVEWIKKYITPPPKKLETSQHIHNTSDDDGRKSAVSDSVGEQSNTSDQDSVSSAFYLCSDDGGGEDMKMVRDILFSSRENIDFIHEVFRQTLRLCFRYSVAMKTVIHCYCDWIKMTSPELPPFMLEPNEGGRGEGEQEGEITRRLRNDSYIGAMSSELHVRAGLQNVLQVFVTSAANVFLLAVPSKYPKLLDEQVDLCKLVLNIYRYMVMNSRMEQKTWEQLLVVLFHITSQTLSGDNHNHKVDSLGRRFAAALFQTLIVSWIKANLSVVISTELWDQLLATLVSLTHWEELIKEWAKTMDTLTKVLARHVYDLELNNLPLDRVTERKALKKNALKISTLESSRNTLTRGWGANKISITSHQGAGSVLNHGNQTGQMGSYHSGTTHEDMNHHGFIKHRNSNSSNSSIHKISGNSENFYRSNSDNHSSSHYHHHGPYIQHKQHSEGYFRHHIYSSHRRVFKWASDPAISKKSSYSGYARTSSLITYSRSLDYFPYGGDDVSRSSSPAPSSDMDSSSLKDNPVQISIVADTASLDTFEDGVLTEQRSVMSGGSVRGWLPDVSVVLWRRVLGLLGDPNDVSTPRIHEQIFKYLLDLTETLIKLRNNQGISLDNQTTPQPSELVPPVTICAQWCFRALTLPPHFSSGKILAYQLLCKMMVRSQDIPLSKDLIAQFYRTLHQGFVGHDQDVIGTLINGCSPNFFSLGLPGSSMLALDVIYAGRNIISSNDSKMQNTRLAAVPLLGSLYALVSLHQSMPVLQPVEKELTLISCSEVKDHLIQVLLKYGKKEPYWKTRAQALCALSLYLYHELSNEEEHNKVMEAIELILASLKVGKLVSQIAADHLLLLTDYSQVILSRFPKLIPKIIQVICQTLSYVFCDKHMLSGREGHRLVLSLMFSLAEWVMSLPQMVLIQPNFDKKPILHLVFKTLNMLHNDSKPSSSYLKAMKLDTIEINSNVKEDFSSTSQELHGGGSKGNSLRRNANSASNISTIKLAARAIMNHIVNHLWQFPLGVGPHRLSSLVCENDDLPEFSCEEISSEIFLSPHVQFFALNRSCIMSLVQLPALQAPGGAATIGFKTPNSEVRIILRDLSGKFCWDASTLYAPPPDELKECITGENTPPSPTSEVSLNSLPHLDIHGGNRDDMTSSILVTSSVPRHPQRHRPIGVLPSVDDSAHDLDNLDDLLSYIGHTSPEILEHFGQDLNEAVGPPHALPSEVQHEAITTVLNQRNVENEYLLCNADNINMICPKQQYPGPNDQSDWVFQHCRKFFDQMGLASFDKRRSIFTLRKNEKLLREIKNLDNQKCRETHKVAVIYVAEGQEDKTSILSNSGGSEEFEEFVSGLGWEVELASHTGFMGGLQRNGTTGDTAPYYATSLTEVIFHVSTRMPSSPDESIQKLRHLGNDEVHIVWSEHWREYRRGIIPTEFCDVLIIVYPLENRLYRIQISTKPDVPFFGPLFDGAVVNRKVLSKLVRATALNASRAKRSQLPFYQHFYEERARSLETIIEHHSESTTFERFVADVYAPVTTSAISRSSRTTVCTTSTPSALAAALLDRPSQSPSRPPLTRPTSYSVGEHHNVREKVRSALGSDPHSSGSAAHADLSVDISTSPSVSPRSHARFSFNPPRKMGIVPSPSSSSVVNSSTSPHQHPHHHNSSSTASHQGSKFPPESPVAPPRRNKEASLHHSPRTK